MIESISTFIIIFCLGISTALVALVNVYDKIKKIELGQGHVYAMTFLTVSIIGFTGLANVLFKLELFL
jgi:uncharacterized membrane protein YidH (DUF202 family)